MQQISRATGDKIFAEWKRIAVPRKFLSPGATPADLERIEI